MAISLGGGPRPGRDQSPGRGPRLDGNLSLGGGPRPGGDQCPRRGPRQDGNLSLGGGPWPGRDPRLDGDIVCEMFFLCSSFIATHCFGVIKSVFVNKY